MKAFASSVILRPSIVFGPRDDFFNRFASLAMTAPALPLPGGGKMRMQPVYVENVVSAIMASLGFGAGKLAKSPKGKIYELGGPDIYSFPSINANDFNAYSAPPFTCTGALFCLVVRCIDCGSFAKSTHYGGSSATFKM